ncbi:PREDICTED: uncharacterized protein LOC109342279 [Lupinus angustifolius]|uniref:uncharacterized protein LOC109342279 n=1 Tax=Lupinus angustifolius TaxID=3871 RepID=UPI00092E991B|nr:PREDICTED: uncharacterized protein LOC109342279 [Lupinus angustifolius]
MKEAYHFTKPPQAHHNWCSSIWSISIPPSKSFVTWRLFNNRIPTDENLKTRGMALASICNLCWSNEESSTHLFFNCNFANSIWNWLSTQFGYYLDNASLQSLMSFSTQWSPQLKQVLVAGIINSISIIWHRRNKARFDNLSISFAQAIAKIKLDTSFTGNFSKLCARPSLLEFSILKAFHVHCNYSKTLQF